MAAATKASSRYDAVPRQTRRRRLRHEEAEGRIHKRTSSEGQDEEEVTTAAKSEDVVELDAVLAWRIDVLTHAGYPYPVALELAAHSDVDLHQAVYLAESGCAADTAMRILL